MPPRSSGSSLLHGRFSEPLQRKVAGKIASTNKKYKQNDWKEDKWKQTNIFFLSHPRKQWIYSDSPPTTIERKKGSGRGERKRKRERREDRSGRCMH